ncbi:MAG: Holliday junction branch migration protein RuvA [Oligoflexia bacterium]|nr:Holliday junction branch migration protein RuvA [Oligoflexia bacterium]
MIGYIRGEVLEHSDGKLVLLLESGLGYLLHVPQSAEYGAFGVGQKASFYVHTHVREDALDLYGFETRAEKELFLTLTEVNGIGPKLALGILSKVRPAILVQAILEEDKNSLTEIPGIGKKTAERIVLELGDKVRKKLDSGTLHGIPTGGASKKALGESASHRSPVFNDARSALVGLGYREQDVTTLLNRMLADMPSDRQPKQAEDLVRAALRNLL